MVEILVVDDEPTFRRAAVSLLEGAGYQVTAAKDASQGAQALSAGEVDLVLADVVMPGNVDLAWVTALHEAAHAPRVILVTGVPSIESAARAVGLSVMAYLLKPVDPQALLDTVARCLRTPPPARPLELVADRYVKRWGLTAREREVLLRIARGEANKEIADACGISPRTVEVHVTSLLKKSGALSRAELTARLLGTRPTGKHASV